MRDIWQTTNIDYGANWAFPLAQRNSRAAESKGLLEHGLLEQGVRHPLQNGVKRHEWKAAHGFRKFYKSRAEQVLSK
jgi:hypothetical protein